MNFIKTYKCAPVLEQINEYKKYKTDEKIEIQLLNQNDNLENFKDLKNEIVSIHLPYGTSRLCNIERIVETLKNEDYLYDYLMNVISFAKECSATIVTHASITLNDFLELEGSELLLELIDKSGLNWCIENVVELESQEDCVFSPIEITKYINNKIGKTVTFPLLDICHYQMTSQMFNSDLKYNLKEILSLYKSRHMLIHLSSIVGSGDGLTGGYHGFNFSDNIPLLEAILDYLKNDSPILVLEECETDLINKPLARWLSKYIKEYKK